MSSLVGTVWTGSGRARRRKLPNVIRPVSRVARVWMSGSLRGAPDGWTYHKETLRPCQRFFDTQRAGAFWSAPL